jgi:hypothetical protein
LMRFSITLEDMEEHGATKGCPRYQATISSKSGQAHTEACRRRFAKDMEGDEQVKESKKRENEFLEKALEED